MLHGVTPFINNNKFLKKSLDFFHMFMAALRSNLQKACFQQDGERILAVANVKKDAKKKKELYICLIVTTTTPVSARIYLVKLDKDGYSKKEQFALRDVRFVDGVNPRKPVADFNLTIQNQLYQLTSNSHEEKEFFIRQLFKLSNSYLPVQKPEFINVSLPIDTLISTKSVIPPQSSTDAELKNAAEVDQNYQPISSKEEADFRRLLQKAELQIGLARQFSNALNEQLSQLDSANLSSILENEQNVKELIELIDTAIELAETIERQLDEYDTLLSFVRDSVELIEEKDSLRHIEQQNNKKLLDKLKEFIYLLETVTDQHIEALKAANLSDPISINLCCQAARVVDHFLTKKTELVSMNAYQSKVELLNKLTTDFVDRFYAHTSAIFSNMESMLESQQHIGEIIIQKHSQRHRALLPFSDLIHWLKQTRPSIYRNILDRYNIEAQKIYKREFDRFFSELARRAAANSQSVIDNNWQKMLDEHIMKNYTDLIETAVVECRTVVESEQKFCIRFFHLNTDVIAQISDEITNAAKNENPKKTLEKQLNDQIKFAIGRIFEPLPTYFYGLVSICKDHHIIIIIWLYVVLSRRLSNFCEPSSYFSIIYGSFLVALKRIFDEQMGQIENSFSRIMIPRRSRVGILDTISRFSSLSKSADSIFSNSERRIDLDKWLEKLADAVIAGINSAAESPNSKYPPSIVRMENLHAFYSTLSELKIPCLDLRRKTTRQKYQENMNIYVHELMGRPLEKIHQFFEKVERVLENGVRPEEISYEQQFSRMELKRAISAYPAKEVKKGLESLYKKVEKHLSENSPLLQVVWRQMQEEFLNQVKHYQQLVSKCYPGSKIDLEVSIEDILRFFSEIAQQH